MDRQTKIVISALLAAFAATSAVPANAFATMLARSLNALPSADSFVDPELEYQILRAFGWVFYPAVPKSRLAHRHNYAHQTTWFLPFWYNFRTNRVSYIQPSAGNGYEGDDLSRRAEQERWAAGGPFRCRSLTPVERRCAHIEKQGMLNVA